MKNRLVLLMPILCLAIALVRAEDSNVVIDSRTEVFRFVVGKGDVLPSAVKHTSVTVYRAVKRPDTAVAYTFYNDDVSIKKASGGTTHYGSYFSDDVFYSDSKACLMELKLKGAGATAKATFETVYGKAEYFSGISLAEVYPTEAAVVKFVMPSSLAGIYEISVENMSDSLWVRSVETNGNETEIIYSIRNIPAVDDAPSAPSINVTSPSISVKGYFKDVDELYRYLYKFAMQPDPNPGTVNDMAARITAGCTTDSARIVAINDYVHSNIRYLAVEHGELGLAPDKPSEVLRKRYGDCKGSAGLLRAMLRAVGIDGRYVWIGTDAIPFDFTDSPMLSSGNHMIAAAMTGDSILYIDGTAKFNAVGHYPAGIQGRQVLIEDTPERCIVERVPVLPPNINRRCVTVKYYDDGSQGVRGVYDETGTGVFGSIINEIITDMSGERRENALCAYVSAGKRGCQVISPEIESTGAGGRISAEMKVDGVARRFNNEIYVDLSPVISFRNMIIDEKDRTVPVRLASLREYEFLMTYSIPVGYEVKSLPDPVIIDNKWMSVHAESFCDIDVGEICQRVKFTVKEREIPTDRLAEYNRDLKTVVKGLAVQAVLQCVDK